MRESTDLKSSVEKSPVTPGEVLPARELLGDMFLELERYEEAQAAYETALGRSPNRFNSLYGAGRAAELNGEVAVASEFYGRLVENAGETTRSALACIMPWGSWKPGRAGLRPVAPLCGPGPFDPEIWWGLSSLLRARPWCRQVWRRRRVSVTRRFSMPMYLFQLSYTAKSLAAQIKNPQDRLETAAHPILRCSRREPARGRFLLWGI